MPAMACRSAAGNVAQDGGDGNSPYTKALATTIGRAGLDIFQTFNEVGLMVKRATGGSQQPWVSSSPIDSKFYFKPPADTPASGRSDQDNVEVTFWNSIKDSRNPQLFEAYLRRYPNGAFADIARISLEQFKVAVARPMTSAPDQKAGIDDPGLLRGIQDRLRTEFRSGFGRRQRYQGRDPGI
jgi:Caspase domain